MDADILGHWIEEIRHHGLNLTKWEEDFVESVADQLDKYGHLTARQEAALEKLYADKT